MVPETLTPARPANNLKSEKTKYRLAESIKECMRTTPVDDITVRQIVENCGLTRQTFYRNFLDKYDLINWYFEKLLLESFACMGSGGTILDGLERKFSFVMKERIFFTAAFRSDDHNSVREHDFELILEFYRELIRQRTGRFPDEETGFLLELYCRGSIAMTVKWVLGGMKESPHTLSLRLVKAMPPLLTELFTELRLIERM